MCNTVVSKAMAMGGIKSEDITSIEMGVLNFKQKLFWLLWCTVVAKLFLYLIDRFDVCYTCSPQCCSSYHWTYIVAQRATNILTIGFNWVPCLLTPLFNSTITSDDIIRKHFDTSVSLWWPLVDVKPYRLSDKDKSVLSLKAHLITLQMHSPAFPSCVL